MTNRYLAVVNPAAGGGRCGKRSMESLVRLRAAGLDMDVTETSFPGQAVDIVRDEWHHGRRKFIAVGGDGTSWEVVNGLFPTAAESGETPTLGFLPLGTGNSFLRDFSEQGITYALEAISAGRTIPVDVIRLDTDGGTIFYINILSVGFTADVGALTNRRLKRFGAAGYAMATVAKVARLRPHVFSVSYDGGAEVNEPTTFISFTNSKFTGGTMQMAPHAEVSDGKIAVVTVGKLGRVELLKTFPKIFKGTHIDHPRIEAHKAERIEFNVDEPIDLMIDGEVVRRRPLGLTVLPKALRVHV